MIAVLIENLIPLYILIGLGFICGRWLDVNLHSMAIVAIYILSPVVVFGALLKAEFQAGVLLLPVALFFISAGISLIGYNAARWHLKSNLANLIGMTAGTGNTGYFGLPLVLALLGPQAAGVYILMNLSILLNELTIGYYIGARGHNGIGESLRKLARLPALHAAALGLACNGFDVTVPAIFDTYWAHFTGAWVIVGMMLIGIGLGKIDMLRPNFALLGWLFGCRFVLWPLAMAGLVLADRHLLGLYGTDIHTMMLIIGLVPLAANTVAYAGTLKLPASEAALAVLLSTIFALFFMPFMLWLLL